MQTLFILDLYFFKMTTLQRIDADSQPSIENSLNIFSIPPTSVAFNKSTVCELQPLTALDDTGP